MQTALTQLGTRKGRLLVLLLVFSSVSTTLTAQQTGEDELGGWYMYFGTNRLSDRWSLHTEAQWRHYEWQGNFNQLLLRTGMNYHIDEGTTFEDTPAQDGFFAGNFFLEHRIFEQFILHNKVWEFGIEHRYRLEQRFLDFGEESDTQHRARYRLQVTLPLTNTFFINLYDEVFLNLQDDVFGQNRLYAALGIHITENSNLQVGYLKNHFTGANFDRIQVAVFYNPDLRGLFKKK
jgi:hypothetical protein